MITNKNRIKIIMKKVNLIIIVFTLFVSLTVEAQNTHQDYFAGKWNVVAVGTPGGDSKLIVNLSIRNGKLKGTIIRSGKEPAEISKVEETTNSVNVYFRHLFYKVKLSMVKRDDNHVVGSMMDKYKASGVRMN